MRKSFVAILGAALFSSAAIAADMPVKAPVYLPPPPTWTGFYAGGNIGYSWGEARTDITGNGSTIAFPPTWFAPSPGFPTSFAFADSNKAGLNGVIGGGQIGYNFQLTRNWVVGIEADLQGSGERGSGAFADPFSTPICSTVSILLGPATAVNCFGTSPLTGTALTSYDAKIDWFGTLRGRFGFLLTDQFLIYGTGGLAYGQVELSASNTIAALINSPAVLSRPRSDKSFGISGCMSFNFSTWSVAQRASLDLRSA